MTLEGKEANIKDRRLNFGIYLNIITFVAAVALIWIGRRIMGKYIDAILDESVRLHILIIYYNICTFFLFMMILSAFFMHRSYRQIRRLEEENRTIEVVERSNRAKSEFLANMSHEIRTPINSILGLTEMISRETDQDEIFDYTEDIKSAGDTLLFLINDILDFSKIESGNVEIVEKKYEVAGLINDINNMISVRAKGKNLEYSVDIAPDVPKFLFGDKNRVQQVLINLLTNAVKYTDKGSVSMHMTWDNDVRFLRVDVSDTGKGIKEEDINLLFDKFQRVNLDDNSNIEGSGLGLAITKMLLNKMNGNIYINSVYGEGSTFSVIIPQKPAGYDKIGEYKKPVRKKKRFAHLFSAHDAEILVVDDSMTNLTVIKGLLKGTGLMIETVMNGEDCLNKVKDKVYDIIFLDIRMPGMGGDEVLDQINRQGYRNGVPIVALTADVLSESRDRFLARGFTDYLSKPVSPEELERTIIKFLPESKIHLTDGDSDKAGEIEAGQVKGLFMHLNGYITTRNEEALKSMLGALSNYNFPGNNQGNFDEIKAAFEERDYDRMAKAAQEVLQTL